MKLSHTFLISFLCLFLCISPASALSYVVQGVKGVAPYIPVEDSGRAPGEDFMAYNKSTITIIHAPSYQSSRYLLTGFDSGDISSVASTGEYIFIASTNGHVYRLNNNEGAIVWNAAAALDTGKISSGSNMQIVHHSDGYIYATTAGKITRINPENCMYTVSSFTLPDETNYICSANDGIYTGREKITTSSSSGRIPWIYKWASLNSASVECSKSWAVGSIYNYGLEKMSDGRFIVLSKEVRSSGGGTYYYFGFYNGSTMTLNLNVAGKAYTGFAVANSGIIAVTYTDTIEFIDNDISPSLLSGHQLYKAADIKYDKAEVFTYYNIVHNNTPVNILYNMHIDTDKNKAIGNIDTITDSYNWEIDIIAPDGTKLNTYKIPETFNKKGILSSVYTTSGNIELTPRVNGTYILRLFEIDTDTQEKALLKESTFKVLFESGSAGGEITDRDNVNIVTNFLQSPYFIALIIIGVVVFQFGRDARGQINGSAMVVLVPLSVALTCMMGLLPMWILYLMAMLVIAFIAWSLSE